MWRLWEKKLKNKDQGKVILIQRKLLVAQSKQKKYIDIKVRDMSFKPNEQVLFQVSPIIGVMNFGKKK